MDDEKCLQITGVNYYPYVVFLGKNYTYPVVGVLYDLLVTAAKRLNFCYNLTYTRTQSLGSGIQLENGSFTGAIGEVQRGEKDLMITPVSVSYKINAAVEISEAVMFNPHSALISYPKSVPDVIGFAKPFTAVSWLCILLSTLFAFTAILLLNVIRSKIGGRGQSDMKWRFVIELFFKTYVPVLAQQAKIKFTVERFALGMWMIGVIIIGIIYKSNLMAMLTSPTIPLPFNNFAEMLSQHEIKLIYREYVYIEDALKYADPNSPYGMLYKKAKVSRLDDNGLIKAVLEERTAVLGVKEYMIAVIHNGFSKAGKCTLTVMNDEFMGVLTMIVFKRNSTWRKQFNRFITAYKESGIMQQYKLNMMSNASRCYVKGSSYTDQTRPLLLEDFYGVFALYFTGLIIATFNFMAEITIARLSRRSHLFA